MGIRITESRAFRSAQGIRIGQVCRYVRHESCRRLLGIWDMSPRLLLTVVAGLLATEPPLRGETSAPAEAASIPRSVELKGAVKVGGRAAPNVRLIFQYTRGVQRERHVRIKSDGTYRVKLEGRDTDLVCARIERSRPLNSYLQCRRFSGGSYRFDFDLPPGVIRVEIPPFRHLGIPWASVRVEGARDSAGRAFKPAAGFRGDYLAADFGAYVVTVTDPENDKELVTWPVTLTADQPVMGIKLTIARNKPLSRTLPRQTLLQRVDRPGRPRDAYRADGDE
jgi:hypothetical protein